MSAAPRFVHVPAPGGGGLELHGCDSRAGVGRVRRDRHRPLDGCAARRGGDRSVGGMASTVTEALVPLTAVQEWKTAVTLHTNVPSPGSIGATEGGDAHRGAGAARGTPGRARGRRGARRSTRQFLLRAPSQRSSSASRSGSSPRSRGCPACQGCLLSPMRCRRHRSSTIRTRRAGSGRDRRRRSRARGCDESQGSRHGCVRPRLAPRPVRVPLRLRVRRVVDCDRDVLAVVLVEPVVQHADGQARP